MKQFIKSLFLPLAVFAMLGLGALTLSASNITNDVVTSTETASMQTMYTGDFYVVDSGVPSGYRQVFISPKPTHCTFSPISNVRCTAIIGGLVVELYGYDSTPGEGYKALFEI